MVLLKFELLVTLAHSGLRVCVCENPVMMSLLITRTNTELCVWYTRQVLDLKTFIKWVMSLMCAIWLYLKLFRCFVLSTENLIWVSITFESVSNNWNCWKTKQSWSSLARAIYLLQIKCLLLIAVSLIICSCGTQMKRKICKLWLLYQDHPWKCKFVYTLFYFIRVIFSKDYLDHCIWFFIVWIYLTLYGIIPLTDNTRILWFTCHMLLSWSATLYKSPGVKSSLIWVVRFLLIVQLLSSGLQTWSSWDVMKIMLASWFF